MRSRVSTSPTIPGRLVWAVPALLALHNAEEGYVMAEMLPRLEEHAPTLMRQFMGAVTVPVFLWALVLVTGIAALVAVWAAGGGGAGAVWALVLVQAVLALNVISHIAVAVAVGGYAPGLASALAINLPFSLYFFTRVMRERWVGRAARWWLLPAALVVHGPGIALIFILARTISGV